MQGKQNYFFLNNNMAARTYEFQHVRSCTCVHQARWKEGMATCLRHWKAPKRKIIPHVEPARRSGSSSNRFSNPVLWRRHVVCPSIWSCNTSILNAKWFWRTKQNRLFKGILSPEMNTTSAPRWWNFHKASQIIQFSRNFWTILPSEVPRMR